MAKIKKSSAKADTPLSKEHNSKTIESDQDGDFAVGDFSQLSEKIQEQFRNFHQEQKNKQKTRNRNDAAGRKLKASANQAESSKALAGSEKRGKKRDSNGEILSSRPNGNPIKDQNRGEGYLQMLQEEVRTLGGTEEDLQLVEGLHSQSEDEGQELPSSEAMHLQKGITNILKEIKLAARTDRSASSSPAVSEGGEDNNLQEASNDTVAAEISEHTATGSVKGSLVFPIRPDWFNVSRPSESSSEVRDSALARESIEQLHEYARNLLDGENVTYKAIQQSDTSRSFYSTIVTSGTLSDKISALTLAVQESPVHNMKALESLIALAKKRSRAQAVDVLRALKDLFAQGSLLPSDRKLHKFVANPNLRAAFGRTKSWNAGDRFPKSVRPAHLIIWAYEDWLKDVYFEVLKILEVWCNDEIEFAKSRAVSYVFELLKEKPEQEANLLRMLVNKLGDPVKKIASRASYLIMQLMAAHPLMKGTIVSAIESELIYRPGQSLHAKYYAIVTLNQTVLSEAEEDLANKLLDIYFGLFVGLLKPPNEVQRSRPAEKSGLGKNETHRSKKFKSPTANRQPQEEELQDKLTSAILTGINRAYPYTDSDAENVRGHLDALFKITHCSNFNTSIQALLLIQQLSNMHPASADRFYRTLYESLLDARLMTSSKQSLYLNLLFRSLKADVNIKRVKAFTKRIAQISNLHQPSFVCGALFLLRELEITFPALEQLTDQPEEHEQEEETFRDVDEGSESFPTAARPPLASRSGVYDGRKRDPEHSNADASCLWDLLPFLKHFHPAVAVSADHLARHAKLPGKPDLNLHTLTHFLDRFVYRNPKSAGSGLRGASAMQPMAAHDSHAVLVSNAQSKVAGLAVNSEEFRARKEEEVAAEDIFFHKYFNSLGKECGKSRKKSRSGATERDVVDDEEAEVWKAMMDSALDLEGADGSDDDLEIDDLSSDFEQSLGVVSDTDDESDDAEADFGSYGTGDDSEIPMEEVDGNDAEDQDALPALNIADKSSGAARKRRKQMKSQPTFATADNYTRMVEDDEEEDLA